MANQVNKVLFARVSCSIFDFEYLYFVQINFLFIFMFTRHTKERTFHFRCLTKKKKEKILSRFSRKRTKTNFTLLFRCAQKENDCTRNGLYNLKICFICFLELEKAILIRKRVYVQQVYTLFCISLCIKVWCKLCEMYNSTNIIII